ncbi:MAG: methylated-DNA--[protein]-cysteine S-methyltransferase [bacterium]|nr:methylated-DNA--[protein]-cysteine S-methyltransferase [bacterium]
MTLQSDSAVIDSPVGKLLLVACARGLTHLLFTSHKRQEPHPEGDGTSAATGIITATERQLREYFAGRRREFDLPLAPGGTEFQLAVWKRLCEIPFGQTVSYGKVAHDINRPQAVRAVGAANGANPIAIIVPCHRVIGGNRHLTGFGGGLPAKRLLLELEGVQLRRDKLA